MTAWTCPECASHNADAETDCAVCGAAPPGLPAGTRPVADRYRTDVGDDPGWAASGPATPAYRRRRAPSNRWARWAPLGALALAIAAIAGVKVVPGLLRSQPPAQVEPAAMPATTPATAPPAIPLPTATPFAEESTPSPTPSTSADLVAVDPAAATDPRTQPVAALLDRYFSAINNRDFATALSVYDPAGVVNPDDPAQVDAFTRALSTTYDSQVRILGVTSDTSGSGAVLANVTFRSNQGQGYGPKSNPNETCTVWALTFTLTQRGSDSYLILSSTGDHSACP